MPSPTSFSTALVTEISSSTIDASIGAELIIFDNTLRPSLEYEEEMFEDLLTLEIDEPISEIYDFEFNYDEQQWTTWDNLEYVIRDMIEEMKN